MFVNYHKETGEIELAGDKEALIFLSRKFLEGETEIVLESKDLNNSPYSDYLNGIQSKITRNKFVEVRVENSKLVITGDYEKLKILAENLESFGREGNENEHLHIEYFDNHFYLSPKSAPFVIRHL